MSRISAAVCLLALLLAGCGDRASPLRIALNPWPGYAFLALAAEKGFFEAEGVDVQLVELGALDDVRRAFERGQVDGMAASMADVIKTRLNGKREPRVVMLADFSDGADVIIANGGARSIADLRGKKIGLEYSGLDRYVIGRALERGGLSEADVDLLFMTQSEMPRAFAEGEVEAVFAYPPVSQEIARVRGARIVFTSSELPGEILDVLAFDAAVIDERGPEIVRVLRAWDRAVAFAAQHPDEAYRILANRSRIEPHEFLDSLDGIRVLTLGEQQALLGTRQSVARAIDGVTESLAMEEHGEGSGASAKLTSADLIDATFVDMAVKK